MWRIGTLEDYIGILKCHRAFESQVGLYLDLPKFSDPSILAWWVAERDGVIVQFAAMERLVEFRMGGCDKDALQELMKQAPDIIEQTRAAGVRYIHVCVPPSREKQVARKLRKVGIFKSENELYTADLRG